MIIGIETSDILCSVSFWDQGQVLVEYNLELPKLHSALIGHLVQEGLKLLANNNIGIACPADQIELMAVALGPGSFTGLRIGLSYAQGFCYGRNIPLCGISNHQVLASFRPANDAPVYTIIDAHRQEIYCAKHLLLQPRYSIIDQHLVIKKQQLVKAIPSGSVLIFNRHLELEKALIKELLSEDIVIIDSVNFSASKIAELGELKYRLNGADSLVDIEPLYIRPFAGVQ